VQGRAQEKSVLTEYIGRALSGQSLARHSLIIML
jgi:hypothetical protein